ncbi:TIGR04282 family arsenosugar biosynthesis glycosyltransferase [Daejeonella sp.]|uniref:TIGR04282 family arsenosugar biosynthesis glycosyltransferase n=1 Tax=Daejeonella sp. TaxID=2805397 RepID=UPI0026B79D1D|nr:TIGR04282 family arsenosugar biosynthesis glycosyltransferase [Daejeonella sp.]HQT21697.1 TIGR04282 family arsenosugar biosynthesis glycosyltransferase [Daejeonella sp.]HQT56428.1 TIGR04282 family arsenosugar biosynthesis glycosyltransferase [Daejeonella sp.]
MLSTTALVIFVRNPISGQVKTRLAKDIGDERALAIYLQLLQHTLEITRGLSFRKFIYYADEVCDYDLWSVPGYTKRKQNGNNLGERMLNSFKELFDQGFTRIIIIGSDCLQLKTENLEEAVALLESNNAVIGPANDGGYYLLGLTKFYPDLFTNKPWSTDKVFAKTIDDFINHGISYALLDELSDIDDVTDLEENGISI